MTVITVIGNILIFVNRVVIPLIFAIAFLTFIWGIFQYFIAGGADPEKQKTGRALAAYGIVGFAVMMSVWGLVYILINTFGFNSQFRPDLPTFGPGYGGSNCPWASSLFQNNLCN